jgi:predicted nucleic acid-binding Zn ribbon protein
MRNNMRALLEQALKQSGIAAPIKKQLPKQIWEAVVGTEIATRATPTVLQAGVLHVLVQDHRWRDQLDAMRTELKKRLNARLGKELIHEIRFGLAHAGALPARPGVIAKARAEETRELLSREVPVHLRGAAALSPELREAFLRAGHAAHRAATELRA